jgi:hypothetical protein
MAQTPEGKVKDQIKKVLDKYKPSMFYDMPVPCGYGKPTLDIIGCFHGCYFSIEAKSGVGTKGRKPSDRQAGTRDDMRAAGGKVFVIVGLDQTGELERWLETVQRFSLQWREFLTSMEFYSASQP